jgi:hypothetical protein
MEETLGPLEENILVAHENEWGFRLPDEYRRFLLKYNGGRPEPFSFKFKGRDTGSRIAFLFGIGGEDYRDLLWTLDIFRGRLPSRFFPIANDDGGNLICISMSGEDSGKIFFWWHEWEADPGQGESPETQDNVELIADSFGEFMEALYSRRVGNETGIAYKPNS